MLRKIFLATAASCLLQGSVYAAAIQEYTFQENTTYPVHTAQGVVTQIELDSREKVKDFGAGLSGGWDLVRRENVFYLRPKADAVDTNLIWGNFGDKKVTLGKKIFAWIFTVFMALMGLIGPILVISILVFNMIGTPIGSEIITLSFMGILPAAAVLLLWQNNMVRWFMAVERYRKNRYNKIS